MGRLDHFDDTALADSCEVGDQSRTTSRSAAAGDDEAHNVARPAILGMLAFAGTAAVVLLVVLTANSLLDDGPPGRLAAVDESQQLTSQLVEEPDGQISADPEVTSRTPALGPPDPGNRGTSLLGTRSQPFPPIPEQSATKPVRAVRTPSGVVMPVTKDGGDSWRVVTACEAPRLVELDEASPVGPAHVVLDPGHGGSAPGAVGPSGLTEKEVNLAVALKVRDGLERLGATVVMTRETDHDVTTKVRGLIAEAIDPALFVSIHHNGGGTPGGELPGTIAFTKAGSSHATRFGGLFFHELQPALQQAADERRSDYSKYVEKLNTYESLVDAYDQSVAARDAALVANGQLPPTATTIASSRSADTPPEPRQRIVQSTTTVPATQSTTVPVPTTGAPPEPFVAEPVQPFSFAGSGNRGVRAWIRPDGQDYLSVLRNSGDVPAVLAEFLYMTNPAEEALLLDDAFLGAQADALVTAIVTFFSTTEKGSGFIPDEYDDQPIGGGGGADGCVEPDLMPVSQTGESPGRP